MTEDQNHNRIRLIDVSKGAAITGVVLAHSGVALFGTGDGAMNPILELFYSFLYMFFFISGYLYKPGRTCKENIGRTVKKLFIVFILCTVVLTTIMWVYLVILGYDCPASEFMDTLIASLIGKKTFLPMDNCPSGIFVGYPDISFAYYFIIFLIGAYLVFYPLIDKVRSSLKKTAAVVAVLIVCEFVLTSVLPVHLPYSIEGCLVPAALLFIGAYASQFKILEWIESNFLSWRNAAILVVMLVIAILACTYIPLTVGLSISRFGIYGPASVFVCLITILSSGYVLMNGANILGYIPFFVQSTGVLRKAFSFDIDASCVLSETDCRSFHPVAAVSDHSAFGDAATGLCRSGDIHSIESDYIICADIHRRVVEKDASIGLRPSHPKVSGQTLSYPIIISIAWIPRSLRHYLIRTGWR